MIVALRKKLYQKTLRLSFLGSICHGIFFSAWSTQTHLSFSVFWSLETPNLEEDLHFRGGARFLLVSQFFHAIRRLRRSRSSGTVVFFGIHFTHGSYVILWKWKLKKLITVFPWEDSKAALRGKRVASIRTHVPNQTLVRNDYDSSPSGPSRCWIREFSRWTNRNKSRGSQRFQAVVMVINFRSAKPIRMIICMALWRSCLGVVAKLL